MRRMMRLMLAAFVLVSVVVVIPGRSAGAADAVVSAPCTEAEFDAALATIESTGGGTMTFDCGGPDVITFSVEKTISSTVRIDGADLITLSGGDVTRHFRVLGGGSLTLERLVLENGFEDAAGDYDGGSIKVEDGGALTILDSTLRANRAEFGGAILVDGYQLATTLTIERSVLVENEAFNGSGGAIYADGGGFDDSAGAVVTITDSYLTDNFATDGGGAIFNGSGGFDSSSGAALTITGSDLLRNSVASGYGGAIFNNGGAFNQSTGGSVNITSSTLADNFAGDQGGAIYNKGGGSDEATGGTVTVLRSTLSGNHAAGYGGAIYNGGAGTDYATGGDVQITNSTLSDNLAGGRGGAIYNGLGNGADTTGGTVQLRGATITQNDSLSNEGDGLYNASGQPAATMTLRLAIVADNDTAGSGVDCEGTIISRGRNLDSDATCQLNLPHDVQSGNAALQPLADNGGSTWTHLPGANSDAIDAGPATCMEQDQRELPRPAGTACDIGAVEIQPSTPVTVCVNTFTGQVISPASGSCAPAGYYEVTMPNVAPQTFCYDPFSGALSHALSGVCAGGRIAHTTPADGDLLTCVSTFTGINRRVADHSQCSATEWPNTLPAA